MDHASEAARKRAAAQILAGAGDRDAVLHALKTELAAYEAARNDDRAAQVREQIAILIGDTETAVAGPPETAAAPKSRRRGKPAETA